MSSNVIDLAIDKAGSQRELAKIIGCSQQAVCKWKKAGAVSPKFAMKTAQFVGVDVVEVLKETENDNG